MFNLIFLVIFFAAAYLVWDYNKKHDQQQLFNVFSGVIGFVGILGVIIGAVNAIILAVFLAIAGGIYYYNHKNQNNQWLDILAALVAILGVAFLAQHIFMTICVLVVLALAFYLYQWNQRNKNEEWLRIAAIVLAVLAIIWGGFNLGKSGNDINFKANIVMMFNSQAKEQYQEALEDAQKYADADNAIIKKGLASSYYSYSSTSYDTSDGATELSMKQTLTNRYSKAAAEYAMNNINVDWNKLALQFAKYLRDSGASSKSEIYKELTEGNDGFTKAQAQYATDHLTD